MAGAGEKRWIIEEQSPEILETFISSFPRINPVLLKVLINRGIKIEKEIESFLSPGIDRLHNPFTLPDMRKAADRLIRAVKRNEKIMVFGDYDADGITATALLVLFLEKIEADVTYYLPDRLEEGYGLSRAAVEYAGSIGIKVLVTVDCGTTDFDEVDYLGRLGIDVIVTDHHEIECGRLPAAHAVVNPHRDNSRSGCSGLAGVGIAYDLARACGLVLEGKTNSSDDYLDFVALGTVADVAPLIGENRILVVNGLSRLMRTGNIGLQALIEEVRLGGKKIAAHHIAFILGPRINASGRLGSAEKAIRLFLTRSHGEAEMLAADLSRENRERQGLESRVLKDAMKQAENDFIRGDERVMVLGNKDWHPGVIGIVASRLVERFHRPVLIVSMDEEPCRCSGRSIRKFHLRRALEECRHLLDEFGGHEYACGLTVGRKNLPVFREKINELARRWLSEDDLIPGINVDTEVSFSELTGDFPVQLEKFAPFGAGNPRPVFVTRGLRARGEPERTRNNGWRMWVTDGEFTFEAVNYGAAAGIKNLRGDEFSLAYSPVERVWEGHRVVQLQVKDIKAQ